MKKYRIKQLLAVAAALSASFTLTGCIPNLKLGSDYMPSSTAAESVTQAAEGKDAAAPPAQESLPAGEVIPGTPGAEEAVSQAAAAESAASSAAAEETEYITSEPVAFDPSWEYAANSKINSGTATLYHAKASEARGIVVCINAGHGTKGGGEVRTLCHPDGTPKVTGGTTEAGATEAVAVSTGMTCLDGTPEAEATLKLALIVRDRLLMHGYDVLMIRESEDVQLDNIARTLMANNWADCHISLHYDGTESDKGVYFMSVPSSESYRSMEPVASHYEAHNALGRAVVKAIEAEGLKLFEGGELEMDLTQTSYSTVPSIDLEVGDAASDRSESRLDMTADGIVKGLDAFFADAAAKTQSGI